jgi:hypothetical protein
MCHYSLGYMGIWLVVLTPTQLAYISRHNFQPLTADR